MAHRISDSRLWGSGRRSLVRAGLFWSLIRRQIGFALLACFWTAPVLGQAPNSVETLFERDINRYRWTAGVRVNQPVSTRSLSIDNRFTSDAFILFNNLLSFRDENVTAWSLRSPAGRRFSPDFEGRFAWYSQSRVLSQDLYSSVRVPVYESLVVSPAVGFALDQRPGATPQEGKAPLRRDAGPAFGGSLSITPTRLLDYAVQLNAVGNVQFITPRRARSLKMNGRAERLFDKTRFATTATYSNVRRDAYQSISFLNRDADVEPLSETIEATTSDTLAVTVELETPLSSSFQLSNRVGYRSNNRKIRTLHTPEESLFFDTDFNRRKVDIEVDLSYASPRFTSRLTFSGTTEVEQRQLIDREELPDVQAIQKGELLEQADYDRNIIGVRSQNRAALTDRISLQLEASASILRHDTPAINQDDRDESFFRTQMGLEYRLSPYITMQFDVYGTYFHTVYLKARRSAENNVQRSLRFRPSVRWTPSSRTAVRFRSEVRATYTVDDFVLEGRRPTDQAARELRYEGDIEHRLGPFFQLLAEGGVSDLRLGRFLRSGFAEIPFDTLQTYSGWIRIRSQGEIQAEVGARAFIRTDFERASTVRYRRLDESGAVLLDEQGTPARATISRPGRRWIEQIGPTFALSWVMNNTSVLRLDGWLNVQRIRQRLYGDLPEGLAKHIRAEARRGTRRIIPNLSISVLWNL